MDDAATKLVLDSSEVGAGDVSLVGGKCASLGELFGEFVPKGVRAVDGFSTISAAYLLHLATEGLEARLGGLVAACDTNDNHSLKETGRRARTAVLETPLPPQVRAALVDGYRRLGAR